MTEPSPTRLMSPVLVLGTVLWLLGSWVINALLDSAGLVAGSGVAIAPAARGLLMSGVLGAMLVWPAWRLSQAPPRQLAGAQVGADMVAIFLVMQLMVWPLSLGAQWAVPQTAVISLTLLAWLLATALVVWAGWLGRTRAARTWAMIGCGLLVFGGYLVTIVTGLAAASRVTPITMLWLLADPERGRRMPDLTGELLAVLMAVVVAWAWMLQRQGRLQSGESDVMMQ